MCDGKRGSGAPAKLLRVFIVEVFVVEVFIVEVLLVQVCWSRSMLEMKPSLCSAPRRRPSSGLHEDTVWAGCPQWAVGTRRSLSVSYVQGAHRCSGYFIPFYLLKPLSWLITSHFTMNRGGIHRGQGLAQGCGGKQDSVTPHCPLPRGPWAHIS